MSGKRGVAALLFLVLVGATTAVAAPRSGGDSPTLIINKRIGDVVMGETRVHVEYDYGTACIAGCVGRSAGCVLGLTGCVGPIHRYKVEGGSLSVGYRWVDHRGRRTTPRVVFLLTNSPYYQTAGDLGVGTHIPFGKRYGSFRYDVCGPGDYAWTAGTSWRRPLWKWGRYRWWTRLYTERGVVKQILMWRGDVNLQGC